jgi:hypothetical protein
MSVNTFWLNDPMILFNSNYILELFPKEYMSREQKLNAITRLVFILTFLGFLITQNIKIIITGVITIIIIGLLYKLELIKNKDTKKGVNLEGFTNPNYINQNKNNHTLPTKENPIMNVLLTDISDNPDRKSALPAYNSKVEKEINSSVKSLIKNNLGDNEIVEQRLFREIGDNFGFEQSMRNFYATPNTLIPNDQEAFANFCYGGMISCKDGDSLACIKNNPRHINY